MKKEKNLNTENQILEAAKSVFQQKGLDGARMQEIADKAGINKAMLHYYYRSKQLLFEAVFANAFMLLAPQLNKILNADSSIETKIKNFTANYISFVSLHPYLPNFVIQELHKNPSFVEKIKSKSDFPNLAKFKKQVNDEVQQNILKPIDAEQLFINILSLSVFPFIGTHLIKAFIDVDDDGFQKIIEERKTAVAAFIIASIKK